MKRSFLNLAAAAALVVVFLAAAVAARPVPAGEAAKGGAAGLTTLEEKASYAVGLSVGRDMRRMHADIKPDLFVKGFQDGLAGKKPALGDKEQEEVRKTFFDKVRLALPARNLKAGQDFLAANKKKEGVVATKSGLQYTVIKAGEGKKPGVADRVKVHYRGTLLDGTVFDSSYRRGKPAVFGVSQVIRGWTEGLQLMKVGAKYKFFIPAGLAYGERGTGRGGPIGPNCMLIFEVELLGIEE
ncbi:MAG: FKBP-type peptidyl-prolyl cis-trans isomerase [Planctomycetota bacterium]|jgi:FKBP-type peptidyl-prolyl cis-trans isomerase